MELQLFEWEETSYERADRRFSCKGNDEEKEFDKNPSEIMKSINDMLVPAFEKRFLEEDKNQKQFIISILIT